ncbi:hypothetical protein J8J27_24560, partial [Mycobacterium tuberculosis]|nr:hypothetical protein [Mycobacterium tuberculosis]
MRTVLRQQAASEAAYEDRITALRLQLDRVTSRQILDQDGIAEKIERLVRQQAALNSTSARLNDILQ